MTPSQSSSVPLHASTLSVPAPQPAQVITSSAQRSASGASQGWPRPKPSSAVPSQSLSIPSHASGVGPTPPMQGVHVPPMQNCCPSSQAPTLLPQDCTEPSTHEQPSSVVPSQSSST